MKNLKLKDLDVQELNVQEMNRIQGGGILSNTFSVLDTEFSSIRDRLDVEMKKMEDEMSKFRSELMNRLDL